MGPTIIQEMQSVVKNLSTKKTAGPVDFINRFYITFKKNCSSFLEDGKCRITFLVAFHEVNVALMPKLDGDGMMKGNRRRNC